MEGQDQNDELFPIAVLIDELKVNTRMPWEAECEETDTTAARRCPVETECHPPPVNNRARTGPGADKR